MNFLDPPASHSNALPGISWIVAAATEEFPRHSEADLIELATGRLLLVWARKQGASDFAVGTIVGAFSTDGGRTWDKEPHIIRKIWGDVTDVMSISLRYTLRGLHLFFLGRGPDKAGDTRVYQMTSTDNGVTWSEPQKVSQRSGYHILNNARVIRLAEGRLLAPVAYVPISIHTQFNQQRVFCLYSDDNGLTWRESQELVLPGSALMEPGVAECNDGSLYMTIRTARGYLFESRSHDRGLSWDPPSPSVLVSPAAPSTVVRDPTSNALWMFWCSNPAGAKAGWADRSPQSVAISYDHGYNWEAPRFIETDTGRGFGYISVTVVGPQVHLTYYDWKKGNPHFHMTQLRHRMIPLEWMRGQVGALED